MPIRLQSLLVQSGAPVQAVPMLPIGGGGAPGEGGIPSAPEGGPREPPARVSIQDATTAKAVITPRVAGTAHVILAVTDEGTPALTSYRRVILTIKGAK